MDLSRMDIVDIIGYVVHNKADLYFDLHYMNYSNDYRQMLIEGLIMRIQREICHKKPWMPVYAKDIAAELGLGLMFTEKAFELICEKKTYTRTFLCINSEKAMRYISYNDVCIVCVFIRDNTTNDPPSWVCLDTISSKLDLDIEYVKVIVQILVKEERCISTTDGNDVKMKQN
jgi:hypothetical protein